MEFVEIRSGSPQGLGGNVAVFEPWQIDDGALTPLAYQYRLPTYSRRPGLLFLSITHVSQFGVYPIAAWAD